MERRRASPPRRHTRELNVQNRPKIMWPSSFVVARAYIDELARSGALPQQRIAAINSAIDKAGASHSAKDAAPSKNMAASLEKDAGSTNSASDAERMRALAVILKQKANSAR